MSIIRSAIATALDHPFHELGFEIVDQIEEFVTERVGFDDDPFEAANQIAEEVIDSLSTIDLATAWAILWADGATLEEFGEIGHETTSDLIRSDLSIVLSRAALAGLEAGNLCRECGEVEARPGDWGLCDVCLHDALRSGWIPGE